MALYRVKCELHGEQEVIMAGSPGGESFPCPICSEDSPRIWDPPGGEPFKSYFTEALATGRERIVEVTSREQERDLCRRLGAARVS